MSENEHPSDPLCFSSFCLSHSFLPLYFSLSVSDSLSFFLLTPPPLSPSLHRFLPPCISGPRENALDFATSGCPDHADSLAPLRTRQIHQIDMDENSLVIMVAPQPEWINQADCIDM